MPRADRRRVAAVAGARDRRPGVVAFDAVAEEKYQVSDPLGSTTPPRVAEAVSTAVAAPVCGAGRLVGHSRVWCGNGRRHQDDAGDQRTCEQTTQAVDLSRLPGPHSATQGSTTH